MGDLHGPANGRQARLDALLKQACPDRLLDAYLSQIETEITEGLAAEAAVTWSTRRVRRRLGLVPPRTGIPPAREHRS